MPFVRYARDRRGYETVYVMHAFDGAEKSPRVRVLYACRTVPHAKVGRHAIDESVQRRIEQAYPALTFDWPKLLKEAAASAPRPERPDSRATEPRGKQGRERKARAVPRVPSVSSVPQVRFEMLDAPESIEPITELVEWMALEEPEALEPIGPLTVDRAWPVVGVIGADRTLILRGRYVELAHRILSRVSSAAERARLLREAARLNPESWTTDDQAQAGLAAFEERYSRLAEQLRRQPPV